MGENERFERDNLAVRSESETTSFSQLLFAGDEIEDDDISLGGLGSAHIFTACGKTPRMLCFGERAVISETTTTISTVTCSDSSSSASSTNNLIGTISKSNNTRKRSGPGKEPVQSTSTITENTANQRSITSRKAKTENPNKLGKRREKLGERIAALQQLVSPFGKTDTASVLHEAMGYIRFLQEQVQVLCSPYLQRFPNSLPLPEKKEGKSGDGGGVIRKDLRSRGLCLVPVECTVHVANTNGADLWSPSMASNVVSSSIITKQ